MKKISLLLVVMTMLVGCSSKSTPEETTVESAKLFNTAKEISYNELNIVTDIETGCDYIYMTGTYKAVIIPRMNADGKQVCK